MREATQGCVLAGGAARRMGGEKALRSFGRAPLLAHVVARLAPQCAALAVNANGDAARFAGFGLPVWPDEVADRPGPLAGVLAALTHSAHPWLVTAPCDMPFLPMDLVARLHVARAAAGVPIACAAAGGETQPLLALWPRTLAPALIAALAAGARGAKDFLAAQGFVAVEWPGAALANLNTPEELAAAEARQDTCP